MSAASCRWCAGFASRGRHALERCLGVGPPPLRAGAKLTYTAGPMNTLVPYLFFSGKCEQAFAHYVAALGGQVESLMRFGDAPMPTAEEDKNRVMHGVMRAGDLVIMGADGKCGETAQAAGNVSLMLSSKTPEEQDKAWAVLSEGATITLPLQQQFWGARFGMLTDKFGIAWMLNCETQA